MAIEQLYSARAANLIFNLLCDLAGLGAGGTWQICCVRSDQPCPTSTVHAGNVLILLFLVADSTFTLSLSPSSSFCHAELSPQLRPDRLALKDRQKPGKGRLPLLQPCCFCGLSSEPGLALSAPSMLPGKATNLWRTQKLSFSELVLSLACL